VDPPAIDGLVVVFDVRDGSPVAFLLEGGFITDLRTGAAGGVAARFLAPRVVGTVAVIGTGIQARFQLDALAIERPGFTRVRVWGRNAEHAARANAQQSLAGIAGYQFQNDDPTTQQDESLQLNYDPNANINSGDRSRQTALEARNSVNSNLQGSSFADKAVGSALGRLSLQAQGVVNQYSSTINGLNAQYSNAVSGLMGDLVDSYGADAQYMLDNVPPPAPVPDATAAPAAPPRGWRRYAPAA
jgi:hypothetical protein